MSEAQRPTDLLVIVGSKLILLPRRVVFVGGATTELLITDPAASEVRATVDVDVVVEAASYSEYMSDVANELRALGAREDDSEHAPLCRWVLGGVIVDVMTPDASVLGFTNRWYEATLEQAEPRELPDGTTIHVATAPLFLATKIEAFRGRGDGDFLASKDMEDIIAVLDGREEVMGEIADSAPDLQRYLRETFSEWLEDAAFRDCISAHLAGDAESQERSEVILERIETIVGGTGDHH